MQLSEPELHILRTAFDAPDGVVRLCHRRELKPVEGAAEVLATAEKLVERWLLTYLGNHGGQTDPHEPICGVYQLTSYGRAFVEIEAGGLELDGEGLTHPGCA